MIQLKDENLNYNTRWLAASSLGKIGTGNQEAIDALVIQLKDENLNYNTRWLAVSSLENIDPGNKEVINALVLLLKDKNVDYDTRWLAALSLRKIGTDNQEEVSLLFEHYLRNLFDSGENIFSLFFDFSEEIFYYKFYEDWRKVSVTNRVIRKLIKTIYRVRILKKNLSPHFLQMRKNHLSNLVE